MKRLAIGLVSAAAAAILVQAILAQATRAKAPMDLPTAVQAGASKQALEMIRERGGRQPGSGGRIYSAVMGCQSAGL